MITRLWLTLASVSPSPSPSPSPSFDPEAVSPGPVGFAAIALLAFAAILLIWDMMRRFRRARYRAEVRERLDREADTQRNTNSGGHHAGP